MGLQRATHIWNADETGCPLCLKSGKVIGLSGAKDVYQVTGNTKAQITSLCAVSASENVIPPVHILKVHSQSWIQDFIIKFSKYFS